MGAWQLIFKHPQVTQKDTKFWSCLITKGILLLKLSKSH